MLIRRLSLLTMLLFCASAVAQDKPSGSLTLVVMDPLSAPLACDCVKGYAQRKYEKLGAYLQRQLAQSVDVVWGETLEAAREKSGGAADIIIGKHSVVLADAKQAQINLRPLAAPDGPERESRTDRVVCGAKYGCRKIHRGPAGIPDSVWPRRLRREISHPDGVAEGT
ncbi:MAG UNVERIFIED_CONTAM: hypothetical protein LVR18_23465 [Planctomycetaceae bacterium]|jgi:hypothetical protein